MKKSPIAFLSFLILFSCTDPIVKKQLNIQKQRTDSLLTVLKEQRIISDSLKIIISSNDSVPEGYPIFFGKKYEKIENPEEFIINQLRNQPEKIPLSPVVGGTMNFRKIDILSEKWLMAIYDDGHIQGKALFEYELQPDGSLRYTILATQN